MDCYERKYDDLLYDYKKLERNYDKLKEKYDKIDAELDSANFKIRNELEPRIQQERRSYDNWATNPER